MELIEKHDYYINLFDFYGNILTEKQRLYFTEYYFDDLSLSEIAQKYNISRNAVYDNLQKVHHILERFEECLGLYDKFLKRNQIYEQYESLNNDLINELIAKLKEIE